VPHPIAVTVDFPLSPHECLPGAFHFLLQSLRVFHGSTLIQATFILVHLSLMRDTP
jgi:hypothetical protein